MIRRLGLIAHSLLALKPEQLLMLGWRRGIQPRLVRYRGPEEVPALPDAVGFRFLNRERQFAPGSFQWQPDGEHRLWVYNLHYFDFLNDDSLAADQQIALVLHWIAANPKGYGPGWEPYPTSLRLVNWCQWLPQAGLSEPDRAQVQESIRLQADWLSRHLETHILANHYFENLKALLFVNVFFGEQVGRLSLTKIEQRFLAQLKEQFLADGGHYERSPSYHCLLLNGLLDLIELDQQYSGSLSSLLSTRLREKAIAALQCLRYMELPGDSYPLFNDSAFDSAPRPSLLYKRAAALGLAWTPDALERQIVLKDFGVYGWRDGRAGMLAIKCGAVGPDYQPGHTHCDLLSFEWYLDGLPFVVDTGVYEYQPGAMRHYVRSTVAHNTVAIDEGEQSEIWGEFRVARRARVLAASLNASSMGVEFLGDIEGFHNLGARFQHQRRLGFQRQAGKTTVYVEDLVTGPGERMLTSRVLFHPSVTLSRQPEGVWHVFRGKQFMASLNTGALHSELIDAPYCPEFGVRHSAKQLVMRKYSQLPAKLSYTFDLKRP